MLDCEQSPSTKKKEPIAVIRMRWDDEVVLKKENITATLKITPDGTIIGKVEREIKMPTPR